MVIALVPDSCRRSLGDQAICSMIRDQLPQMLRRCPAFVRWRSFGAKRPGIVESSLGGTPIERSLGRRCAAQRRRDGGICRALVAGSWRSRPSKTSCPGNVVTDLSHQRRPTRLLDISMSPTNWIVRSIEFWFGFIPKRDFQFADGVTQTVDAIRDKATWMPPKTIPNFTSASRSPGPGRGPDAHQRQRFPAGRDHALAAVFVGLVVMFRSIWLAVAAELALGVAIGWTFGWTTIGRRAIESSLAGVSDRR